MSENGPREGTRDLPRRDPEAGRRSVDPESNSGKAYRAQARQEERRAQEIRQLAREGLSTEEIAHRYRRDHPQERPATAAEVDELVREMPRRRIRSSGRSPG